MNLILGHNQFVGISHLSEERSEEMNSRFTSPQRIMEVVEAAYDIGVRSMIVETHPRMLDFLKYYSKVDTVDMSFILQIPNVQEYIRTMNNKGIEGMAMDIIRGSRPTMLIKGAMRSVKDVVQNNYAYVATTGLELIASPYYNYDITHVMVHNVITDFLLGLGMADVLMAAKERMEDDYDVPVGFVTLNLPMFLDDFEEYRGRLNIMTPVNPLGYDMNDSKEEVEDRIRATDHHIMAMNILGGGSIPITEAVEYIKNMGKIEDCIIGSSNPEHIREAYMLLNGK
jgi:hypothetical protein